MLSNEMKEVEMHTLLSFYNKCTGEKESEIEFYEQSSLNYRLSTVHTLLTEYHQVQHKAACIQSLIFTRLLLHLVLDRLSFNSCSTLISVLRNHGRNTNESIWQVYINLAYTSRACNWHDSPGAAACLYLPVT